MKIERTDALGNMMSLVGNDNMNSLPSNEEISQTKSYIQVFLIAQARRELERVVKLTEALDQLQDIYQEKMVKVISEVDDDTTLVMEYLPSMISVITSCLNRSNSIVKQIVGNTELFNVLYVDNRVDVSNSNVTNNNNLNLGLEDPVSRARVRDSVKHIIDMLDKESIPNDDSIIDEEELEVSE